MLYVLIQRLGQGTPCRVVHHVVLGHLRSWRPHYPLMVRVQRALYRAVGDEQTEVEGLVMDLLGQLDRRVAGGERLAEVRVALGASAPLRRIYAHLEDRGWDELHLVLLELFSEPG